MLKYSIHFWFLTMKSPGLDSVYNITYLPSECYRKDVNFVTSSSFRNRWMECLGVHELATDTKSSNNGNWT